MRPSSTASSSPPALCRVAGPAPPPRLPPTALGLAALLGAAGCARTAVGDEPDLVARAVLVPTFTALPPATDTPSPMPSATPTVPYMTPTPDQFERAGLPVRMEIPAIGVDAAMEHVGLTSEGYMDVPKIPADVAWYDRGPLPGQVGNSVVNGHLDSATAPAVFYELRMLIPGDEIVVTYESGERYVFVVEDKERYYFDSAPMEQIAGRTTGRHLNLITCDGAWDKGSANYQQRLVVYTRLVNE